MSLVQMKAPKMEIQMVGLMAGRLVMRKVVHWASSWAQTMALMTDALKYLGFHLAGMSAMVV